MGRFFKMAVAAAAIGLCAQARAAVLAASFIPQSAVKQMITNEITKSYNTVAFSGAVARVSATIPAPTPTPTPEPTPTPAELFVTPEFTNAVSSLVTNKVWDDWTFVPTGYNYSVEGPIAPSVEGELYSWYLLLDGNQIDSVWADDDPFEQATINFTDMTHGWDVIARRKKVNSLGLATLDDITGMVLDEGSLGLNALGELEIRGYMAANASPETNAVFVKYGMTSQESAWMPLSDLIDPVTMRLTNDGRISAKDNSVRHAWAWDGGSGTFLNPLVQICRSVVTVEVSPHSSPNACYYVAINHSARTASLVPIEANPGTTRQELLNARSSVPANTDEHTYFYVATIYDNTQIDGIYSIPVCLIWE